MKTNFLNKVAAAELFGIKLTQIRKAEIWYQCILIVGKHFSRFASKKKFFQALKAALTRCIREGVQQQKTQQIKSIDYKNGCHLVDGHYVYETDNWIECDCKYYKKMKDSLRFPTCKHNSFVIANHLGYSNLRDFIQSKQGKQNEETLKKINNRLPSGLKTTMSLSLFSQPTFELWDENGSKLAQHENGLISFSRHWCQEMGRTKSKKGNPIKLVEVAHNYFEMKILKKAPKV